MRPDPTTLAPFVAAVEEGTIAAAAVSTRLSELEDQLGTRLLRPSNKAIEATAAGVALLGLARGVLHALDEAVAQMGEYSSGARSNVSARRLRRAYGPSSSICGPQTGAAAGGEVARSPRSVLRRARFAAAREMPGNCSRVGDLRFQLPYFASRASRRAL